LTLCSPPSLLILEHLEGDGLGGGSFSLEPDGFGLRFGVFGFLQYNNDDDTKAGRGWIDN
jgi:hypothetical protein